MIERYLKNLPPAINQDPQVENSLYITCTEESTIVIKRGMMIVSGIGVYDLASNTLDSLAAILNALTTFNCTVTQYPTMSALSLMEGTYHTPVLLQSFTSVLWQISMTVSQQLNDIDKNTAQSQFQITPSTATDQWLENIGVFYGVTSQQNEPDELYSTRIIDFSLFPRLNNIAIQKVLYDLGYSSDVLDTDPGAFKVIITLPTSAPQGYIYTLDTLRSMIQNLKASGVGVTITLQGIMSDTVHVTESLDVTLKSKYWTWGDFIWGEFNW